MRCLFGGGGSSSDSLSVSFRQQVSAQDGRMSVNMAGLQKQQTKQVIFCTMTGISRGSILLISNHSKHADKQHVADFTEYALFHAAAAK